MQNVKVDRNKYIGGSDIPIIMGISPFKTRWELLQEKAGIIDSTFEGNEYTEYGNVMEEKIRDYINSTEEDKFVEGKEVVDDIRCHTDGINSQMVLEIKTTSQIHNTLEEYKVYLVQLLFYMQYTKRDLGLLAVYERPSDFNEEFNENRLQEFGVKIEDFKELLEEINEAVAKFRIDLERLRENPFLSEEELIPEEIIDLATEIEEIEKELIPYNELVKKQTKLKEQLRISMSENILKNFTTKAGTKITRIADVPDKEVEETYFDEDKFIAENLELHETYTNKLAEYKEVRTVIKKGKKGSIRITLSEEEK